MPVYKILVHHLSNTQYSVMDVEYDRLPDDYKRWGFDHFAQMPIYAPEDAVEDRLDSKLNHKRK